jgi:outer membrane receptor for ferrienterochelin and colicins
MKISFVKYFCTIALSCCLIGQAQGQTIDYGSLESLFGEPVTTSATGSPQRASEVPVAMEIITADDIRRSGAINIPGVLSKLSGISVWQWGRTQEDVGIRGYNQAFSPRILVLVNGRQVYLDDYGYTEWQTIPVQLEEIRQIEVVKGPNSALYGFNAVGGVINIITYNPMYDNVSNAGVTVGTGNYGEGHLIYTIKPIDKIGIRFSMGGTKEDEFQSPAGTTAPLNPTQHAFSFDSIAQITPDSQLRIELSQSKARLTEYPYVYQAFASEYETNSAKAAYTANTDVGIIQMDLYRNWLDVVANGSLSVGLKNDVTVAQVGDIFQIGNNHSFRLQAEYRHNELTGQVIVPADSEISYDDYAGSGMWNWKMRDNLAWTNAMRVDYLTLGRSGTLVPNAALASNDAFNIDMTEYSYNSGLVWNATNKDTLRLTTARGIQAPSLLDFGTVLNFGPAAIVGNPNMKASVVTNYEVGYDRKIYGLNGDLRTGVFYQKTNELKGSSNVITTGLTQQPGNIGSTHIVGLEAGLNGKIDTSWNWDANYTLQKAVDDIIVNQTGVISVPYNGEKATPKHTLNAHLGYATGPWEVDGYAQYVSHYQVLLSNGTTYNPVGIEGSVNLSARAAYKISDHVTVSLAGTELNHDHVRVTSGPQNERQIFLSLAASF